MLITTEVTGVVGLQSYVAPGTQQRPSMSRRGQLSVAESFREAVEAGRCFASCSQAGVTSQAGLSATTPVLTLYNPSDSGVNGFLHFAGATFTVAFATAGAVWVAANTSTVAAAVTGTLTTAHRNLKLGGAAPTLQTMLAATLPAAPVAIALLGTGLTGAITTIPHIQTLGRWFSGGLIVAPGTAISIQTGVASGASGTFCEYIWEEQDIA